MKHYKLKNRLFAVIAVIVFIFVFLVSLVISNQYSDHLIRQTTAQVQQIINQVALNTGNYISELSRLCLSPYYSDQVMHALETTPATRADLLEKQRTIENYLREVMTIPRKDILRVCILSDNAYSSSRTGYSAAYVTDYRGTDWYRDATESPTSIFLPVQIEAHGNYKVSIFSMALRLQSLSDFDRTVGVIRVDANYSGIQDVLDQVELTDKDNLYILDSSGHIVCKRSNASLNINTAEILSSVSLEDPVIKTQNDRYLLNTQNIDGTDWKVVSVISEKELMRDINNARKAAILLAALCSGISLLFTAWFAHSFTKPLDETIQVMTQARNGDLSVRAGDSRAYEISYLNNTFNDLLQTTTDTMEHNAHLSKEMFEAKYLQKKAQYDSLYNQIRPHFLFNTLSLISLLIKGNRSKEAVESIDELSILLRGMVNADQENTIERELKITESYLRLQEKRHDSLSFYIDYDPEIVSFAVPAMTIQPVVENAIVHGCEPCQYETKIWVSAKDTGDYITLSVQDNGIGMSAEQLQALRESLNDPSRETETAEKRSVGLLNIIERLQLRFDTYTFDIDSAPGKGTTVTLRIPKEKEGAGSQNV